MELQLHDRGCQPVIFLREDAPMKKRDSLSLFSGLARNIQQHLIDGLITTVPLDDEAMELCSRHNVPVCYYGDYTEFPHRVYVDQSFYKDGLQKLLSFGCKRPSMISSGYPNEVKAIFQEVVEPLLGAEKWKKYLFLTGKDPQVRETPEQMWTSWRKLSEKIMGMPEKERPDGLFIPDDFMTIYVACCFLKNGLQLPPLITYRNTQIPLGMPFDLAGYFEGDIMESAQLSVDLLLRQINEPGLAPTEIFYKPEYIDLSKTN
jgi:DNA-binding LacI/PurR family transcriptional regulator